MTKLDHTWLYIFQEDFFNQRTHEEVVHDKAHDIGNKDCQNIMVPRKTLETAMGDENTKERTDGHHNHEINECDTESLLQTLKARKDVVLHELVDELVDYE